MAQRLLLNIRENFERRRSFVGAGVSTAAASETFALSTMAFDGVCLISQSQDQQDPSGVERGCGAENVNVNTRSLERRATMTGSRLSGSTAVSPVSPVNAVREEDAAQDLDLNSRR